MNAFFLIDKPLHISSFDVIRQLRKKLGIKKMGHTGTLDPLATGCLFIATGNYTKLIPFFEKDKKTYKFTLRFDGVTASFDLGTSVQYADNEMIQNAKKTYDRTTLEHILKNHFLGKIEQIPPKYSALKINGKRAVDRVRAGEEVKIQKRKVEVYGIRILDYSFPELTLEAEVSAGTYIRSIASDLGAIVGTGAYVTDLRRTKIAAIPVERASSLDAISLSDALDVYNIFPKEKFLQVPEYMQKKLDTGLSQFYEGLEVGYYFLGKERITNVLYYDGVSLIPKKKIL